MTRPADEPTLPPSDVFDPDATLPPPADPDATLAPSPAAAVPADARAPAGYVIERELGRGGMGVVYLARDVALDRLCALKMILAGAHAASDDAARFRTEAQAIARLRHPGIVAVYEVGEHDGRPFMALEFCPGGSLDAVLAKHPLPAKAAAALVRSLAEAVQAAHAANVLHRDLKPANVLLAADGQAKITDFGLAKKLDEAGATRTGSIMGTPSYMPPEQAEGRKDVGPPADVYALGAILYECLAGRPPFRAATPLDTLMQVLTDEPVPLRQLNPGVPADLETICHKCLQKDPARRYASAGALADDLGNYLAGEPIRARPVGSFERAAKWVRRHAVVATLLALVVLALAGGAGIAGYYAVVAGREAAVARAARTDADLRADAEKAAKVVATTQLARAEAALYFNRLNQAQFALQAGQVARAGEALEDCRPDLRGWEHAVLRGARAATLLPAVGHGLAWSPDGRRLASSLADGTVRVQPRAGGEPLTWAAHPGKKVWRVAFAPDGERLATIADDEPVRFWEAATGKAAFSGAAPARPIALGYSPDGRRLAVAGGDAAGKGEVVLLDPATGRVVHRIDLWAEFAAAALPPRLLPATALAWSGGRLLVGTGTVVGDSERGFVKVYDGETGRPEGVLEGPRSAVLSVACRPDGTVAVGTLDGQIHLWDPDGRHARALRAHAPGLVALAFTADGQRLVAASPPEDEAAPTSEVRLWDVSTGQLALTLPGPMGVTHAVALSPDGAGLAAVGGLEGKAGQLKLWHAAADAAPLVLRADAVLATCAAFAPDGATLVVAGRSADLLPRACVEFRSVASGERTAAVTLPGGAEARAVAVSPDGRWVAVATETGDGSLFLLDRVGAVVSRRPKTAFDVRKVAFVPDGDGVALLVVAEDRTPGVPNEVQRWRVTPDGELEKDEKRSFRPPAGTALRLALSPDGRYAAGASEGTVEERPRPMLRPSVLRVWRLVGGEEVGSCVLTGVTASRPQPGVVSLDGRRVYLVAGPSGTGVWDVAARRRLPGFEKAGWPLELSADGRLLLSGRVDDYHVHDFETGQALRGGQLHTADVVSVAWSQDGSRAAAVASDGGVRVWDPRRPIAGAARPPRNEVVDPGLVPDPGKIDPKEVEEAPQKKPGDAP